jgi:hypothetical protein
METSQKKSITARLDNCTWSRVTLFARVRGGLTWWGFPSFSLPFSVPLARFGEIGVPRHELLHDPLPLLF